MPSCSCKCKWRSSWGRSLESLVEKFSQGPQNFVILSNGEVIKLYTKDDNEMEVLEFFHHFVEIYRTGIGSVCELDLIFNLHKARGKILGEDGIRVHSLVLPGLSSSATVHFSSPGEVRLQKCFEFILQMMEDDA